MSTFEGIIKEIPGISVDRFDGKNLNSTAFFLSHCHSDHMSGLNTVSFQNKLITDNLTLYVSSVSAEILKRLYPEIQKNVQTLPVEQCSVVKVHNEWHVSVTCIPAGHCPGSVMFLFETNHGSRILYTGDFRINTEDITKFKCFYDKFNEVKPVDKIYLDTTFFSPLYSSLPKRQDSLDELCKLILNWTTLDPANCVKLDLRAKYGYEYAFKEIFAKCKMPVHVDQEKFNFYSLIPEMDECVTTNGNETQIHNCKFIQKDVCVFCNKDKLRIIRLSAFRWHGDDFTRGISEVDSEGVFYVCYSTHASYQEGRALINFLRPKDIHVCVKEPNNPDGNVAMEILIKKELDRVNRIEKKKVESTNKLFSIEQIGWGEPRKRSRKNEDSGGVLDSPPR
ncbi:protein artemis [Anthonomus grandis grandis]|uniref:protein artemis n=1 Tax=Anthonomus grandis grandis TaxID=2921223 RepID=UPI0021660AA1|nr:protein artemis [Anthonomus grandis grandis]